MSAGLPKKRFTSDRFGYGWNQHHDPRRPVFYSRSGNASLIGFSGPGRWIRNFLEYTWVHDDNIPDVQKIQREVP